MPAFHKLLSASEWTEEKRRNSESGDPEDGDHPAEAAHPPVAKLGILNPISEPAEVRPQEEKPIAPPEEPEVENKLGKAMLFWREVKAAGDREFDAAFELLGKYVNRNISIQELDRLLGLEWKDRGDLLAKFRSFIPSLHSTGSPGSHAPNCASAKPEPSPSSTSPSPSPAPSPHLCSPEKKGTGDVQEGRRKPRKKQAANPEDKTPRQPQRRSSRVPKPRVFDFAVSSGKEREALRKKMKAEAELAEQKRQRVEERRQERRQEGEERRQLDVFEAWHKVHLQADLDTNADSGIKIEKPVRDSKFWYPWLNQGGAQVQGPGSSSKSTMQVPKMQWCPVHQVWRVRM